MIKVLVVDDQALVRDGIASLLALSGQVEVVATAANGQQALQLLSEHDGIEVMLLDLRMPVLDGQGVLDKLGGSGPAVLVLTTFDDSQALAAAMAAGAKGFLLKDVSMETLVEAVAKLAGGGRFIQPGLTETLARRMLAGEASALADSAPALSEKEVEIVKLMAAGYANKEIANTLFKSEGTVKNQVSAILAKLEVRDRTQAVLKAISMGLL